MYQGIYGRDRGDHGRKVMDAAHARQFVYLLTILVWFGGHLDGLVAKGPWIDGQKVFLGVLDFVTVVYL